jgi:hypothetical protein
VVSGWETATAIQAKTPQKNARATYGKGLRPFRRENTPTAIMFTIQSKKKTTKPTIRPVTASLTACELNDEKEQSLELTQSDSKLRPPEEHDELDEEQVQEVVEKGSLENEDHRPPFKLQIAQFVHELKDDEQLLHNLL